jgi:betaine-homocysteine S-methyltransferase
MKAVSREDKLEELNIRAVALARQVAQEGGALTAGNLSNTWKYDTKNPEKSKKVVRAMFEEQTRWATDVGVDFMIAETFSHLGEALIALEVIKEARLPAVITFIPLQEKSCDGYMWEEACRILEENGADVVGLNCGRGPDTIIPILEKIREKVSGYVAALPVPYRTTKEQPCFYDLKMSGQKRAFPVGLDPFLLTRFDMADFAVKARDMGIDYIGICCGAGPHHVRAMAEALGRSVPASEYSPGLNLHPITGYDDPAERYCFGPTEE